MHPAKHPKHLDGIGGNPFLGTRSFGLRIPTFAARHTSLGFRESFAIWDSVDGTLFEFHDVLGQRPRLVGKDVLNLPDVIRDVPGFGNTGKV